MNICTGKEKTTLVRFKQGNLYYNTVTNKIYFCAITNKAGNMGLIKLRSGGFHEHILSITEDKRADWKDVTDQWCVEKVGE